MIKEGVIEEHSSNEPDPCTTCAIIVHKSSKSLRITLNDRNLNKVLLSNSFTIPLQEDVRAQLSGRKYFSKLDFKSAFWQLRVDTVSSCNGILCR